ncbi:BF3164 family lipoprotein [Nubsella zeaxanthinifaciens]|uniref:BF3164 family lipoprotein n=1 Tax=Nubsella zeaxanthinifaciens TaxID=392412 RepID=UPI003D013426
MAENEVIFYNFPKEEKPSAKKIINFSFGKATKLFVLDSILVVKNAKYTVKNHFFYLYNLKSKNLIDTLLKLGSDQNEVLDPFSCGIYQNWLWAYDITTMKIVMQPLFRDLKGIKKAKEYSLKTLNYSVQLIDSSQIFINGNYDRAAKVQKIDIATNNIVKEFGEYEKAPKNVNVTSWRNANESFLFLQPQHKMLVSAARFTDKVEIFDLNFFTSKIISGPENYAPEFDGVKFNDSYFTIQRNKNTRFSFVNGCVTDSYIYLLYSGNNHMSKHKDYGKTIFVYDWNGKPVKKITLPSYISCFAVNDDREAYIYDVNDGWIKKVNLNL